MSEEEKVDTRMRLPRDLYERIRLLALSDRRSINAQVIVLLEMAVKLKESKKEELGNSLPMRLAA